MNNIVILFKKKKFKKKKFKKKIHLINNLQINNLNLQKLNITKYKIFKKNLFYRNYITYKKTPKVKTLITKNPTLVDISQKFFNPKCTVFIKNTLNTFSVGSIIKYFKVKQTKYIRRSLKGLKIFLNFLKNSTEKFYLKKNTKYLLISVSGVDYNLVNLKKNIKNLIKFNCGDLFFLFNLKISFTKKKDKKIKAIKKRLRKKIISNFIKNTV